MKGQVGILVLLIVLLTIACLVVLNSRGSKPAAEGNEIAPAQQLQHFKDEAKKIEEMQRPADLIPSNP